MFNGTFKIRFFIDISCLKTIINSDNLVRIFKFRNSTFDLKDNNYKNSNARISKFRRFKMIWSSSFEKII